MIAASTDHPGKRRDTDESYHHAKGVLSLFHKLIEFGDLVRWHEPACFCIRTFESIGRLARILAPTFNKLIKK